VVLDIFKSAITCGAFPEIVGAKHLAAEVLRLFRIGNLPVTQPPSRAVVRWADPAYMISREDARLALNSRGISMRRRTLSNYGCDARDRLVALH
jgi:hypothetical protein